MFAVVPSVMFVVIRLMMAARVIIKRSLRKLIVSDADDGDGVDGDVETDDDDGVDDGVADVVGGAVDA